MTHDEKRELRAVIDGIFYRIGLLKGTKADEALERELAVELESMWNEWCDARVFDMMSAIPEELTEEAVAYIRDILADALGPDFANSEKVKSTLESYIRKAYQNGKKGVKAIAPDTPAELGRMNVFDSNAVRILSKHNCYWLGEHYGKDIGQKIAELTEAAVRDGTGRKQLAADIKEALGGKAGKDYKYWDVAASAALVRSRSFGCISGMSEAEITEYKILAMGDERTCATCGNMNGRVFSVSSAMKKIQSVLGIEDPEKFKNAMPWGNFDPKSSNDKLMKQGRAIPPFHGRCRCTLVVSDIEAQPETPGSPKRRAKPKGMHGIIQEAMRDLGFEAVPEFKTVKEAEQFAYENLLRTAEPSTQARQALKWADFDKFDLKTANEYVWGIMRTQALFPELRENFDGVGSAQAAYRKEGKGRRVNSNVFAFSMSGAYFQACNTRGIYINVVYGADSAKFIRDIKRGEVLQFHPKGCEGIVSVIDHEMGHQVATLLNIISEDKKSFTDEVLSKIYADVIKDFKSREVRTSVIETELSRYAATNVSEFFAEAWAEYLNNPKPRQVAKAIGDRVIQLREERYKK